MKAMEIMTSPVISVAPDAEVVAVARLLLEHRISGMPVVDAEGRIVGMVSEGDLLRRVETGTDRHAAWWLRLLATPEEESRAYLRAHGRQVRDVMTREVISVPHDADAEEIVRLMEQHRIKRVPVLRDGGLCGIVSRANLLQALATAPARHRPAPSDERSLREAVLQSIRQRDGGGVFVNVIVSDGVVHLWGAVDSDATREAIRVAAEEAAGDVQVVSHLSLFAANLRGAMWA